MPAFSSPTTPPEQIRVRREKRERLLAQGKDAYPVVVPPRTHTLAEIRAKYPELEPDTATGEQVGVAGRVMFFRNTGKLCFATLQEGDGTQLQVMLSLAGIGEDSLAAWKSDVDLGDFVFVHGEVISSRRGELSVMADTWQMAAKSLRPMPVAHKEMSEESRVRQRYVDLIVRPEARENARMRVAVSGNCAMRSSAGGASSRSRPPRCCRRCTVALPRGRSSLIRMRSTWICSCVSHRSCSSSAASSVESTRSSRSTGISATRAPTRRIPRNSRCWKRTRLTGPTTIRRA